MLSACLRSSESALQAQSPAGMQPWGPRSPREQASHSSSAIMVASGTPHTCACFSPRQRLAREGLFYPLHKRGNQGPGRVNNLPKVILPVEESGLYQLCQAFAPGSYNRDRHLCCFLPWGPGTWEADCQAVPSSLLQGQQRPLAQGVFLTLRM